MPSAPSHPFLPEPSRGVLSCPKNSILFVTSLCKLHLCG
jgi:hypothetical protein